MGVHSGKIILFADTVVKPGNGNNLRRQAGSSRDVVQFVVMALYSLLLMAVLVVGAPYWLARMATSGRYRAGLGQRLGRVPAALRAAVAGRQVVWVHAVSVGEVLAATRLVAELEAALGDGWSIVVSTTTATGQALARERFGAGSPEGSSARVFYYPLDFAWAVRAYLRALQPQMLVLMESELWPRMLVECGRAGIPVAVVNARVSDRTYERGLRVKVVWGRLLRRVGLFLAQSEEDARRLVEIGARAEGVRAIGNLKYDVRAPKASRVAVLINEAAAGRPIVVAGSTHRDSQMIEEAMILRGMIGEENQFPGVWDEFPETLVILAPRHPERFDEVIELSRKYGSVRRASELKDGGAGLTERILVLDTIGDLAAVYGIASAAFVGGSWVKRGGHNPLEPAQFGVPVLMGPSVENFREIVGKMREQEGLLRIDWEFEFQEAVTDILSNGEWTARVGEHGRAVFEAQSGATQRAVEALVGLVKR
jgi:3-deoxy-D-manno-octulosonic-acid transferase